MDDATANGDTRHPVERPIDVAPYDAAMKARQRRIGLLTGLLGIGVLLAAVGFVAWTESPRVRYAGMSCQYAAIFDRQGPVDAVVLGTSRAQRGVDPAALAAGLGLDPEAAGVVNLARGGRGHGQLHQMLVDLDRERGIRGPIVLEYTPENDAFWLPRPLYYQETSNEGARLALAALPAEWRSKPREPAYARARDLLRLLQVRTDAGVEALLRGTWRRNAARPVEERQAARAEGCLTPAGIGQRPGHRRQLDRRERVVARDVGDADRWEELEPASDDFGLVNQDRQHFYVEEAIAFARERNLPIIVVAMPGYLQAPYAPNLAASFEERFGLPLTAPPPDLVARLDERDLFQDAYHFNERGRALFTTWLAEEIRRVGS